MMFDQTGARQTSLRSQGAEAGKDGVCYRTRSKHETAEVLILDRSGGLLLERRGLDRASVF